MTGGPSGVASRWGVRTRLVVAFGLLCVVTAVAVTIGSYHQARLVILQQAQDAAVNTLTNKIGTLYPLLVLPPNRGQLDRITDRLSDRNSRTMAVYNGLESTETIEPGVVSAGLRAVVDRGFMAWQRVELGGSPLVIGTQLWIVVGRSSRPSGIEVYDRVSLGAQERDIGVLADNALLAGGVDRKSAV